MLDVSGPRALYEQAIKNGEVQLDAAQDTAITALDALYACVQRRNDSVIYEAVIHEDRGLYLWGKVGRGKTYLMDTLAAALDPEICLRQHFHHFMKDVHARLTQLSGMADPLQEIARELSEQYQVLCFDEFFVSDIGDAMLLGRLLMYLFDDHMLVVATSNCEPSELYKDGLQRDNFLPAIKAIEAHMQVLHLSGEKDHRERALHKVQNYFLQDTASQALLNTRLDELQLKQNDPASFGLLNVLDREIPYLHRHEDRIVFDFNDLCLGPRSHFDYIELAENFHTLVLVNVPVLGGEMCEGIKARGTEDGSVGSGSTGERHVLLAPMDDGARRLIALVDELYDQRVILYLSCVVPLTELYTQGSLSFQFERTRSRLIEMGSQQYMARCSSLHTAK